MAVLRKHILVKGMVQGVGFRPFVYRLAVSLNLKGFVSNSSRGVEIEAEGDSGILAGFLERLSSEAPALSKITGIDSRDIPSNADFEFAIRAGTPDGENLTLIPPDIATCPDCLRELFDHKDRRYRYPFINCTRCGPRYTILKKIPYDRPNTTMSAFTMCPDCRREYDNPEDRRFHAQPNACPVCGPKVWLEDKTGKKSPGDDPVREAVHYLQGGKIVAIKGLGGFHLACDAANDEAVRRLRKHKAREQKPLAVMIRNASMLSRYVMSTPLETDVLSSPRRPIVLMPKAAIHPLADSVSPRNAYFGILLPYTPLHHLLFENGPECLVMTSGNISEEPITVKNDDALERLGGIADFFLFHDRDIHIRNDDSITRVMGGLPRPIRRSRGCAPEPVPLAQTGPSVLAVGGELKNTVCLTRKDSAFMSQHIGDLENAETLHSFEETIRHLRGMYAIDPVAVAYDPHPDYLSTKWALAQKGIRAVPVQHHHAHIASCLAENGREDRVIGFAMDGSGYGADGSIWGGEILIADLGSYERVGRLSRFPLAGGDRAVREPWRSAVGLLYRVWKNRFQSEPDPYSFLEWIRSLPFVQVFGNEAVYTAFEMVSSNVNTVQTSSLGRLFDAVSALTGTSLHSAYEGQAAMELEMIMENHPTETAELYVFSLDPKPDGLVVGTDDVMLDVIQDISLDVPQALISLKFHRGLVDVLIRAANVLRERTKIKTAALSGGCFQNRFLLEGLAKGLGESGFEVLTHSLVPANDGGLALGQAASAIFRLTRGSADCP